ncbi:hypothetical protein [Mycolicibacter algericus]|uniref:hypothetical protein n=1 Tax=Mycolicibacter algericus TaxID=1288388 RepID=UPI003C7537CD
MSTVAGSSLAPRSAITGGFAVRALEAGAVRVSSGACTTVHALLVCEFFGTDGRLAGWRIKVRAVVSQPRTGVFADARFIEQLLGSIPNRFKCSLAGTVGRIIFLPDHVLHFCELDLGWLVPGKDFLDFIVT